ncbi:MAG: 16S rRNA (guanine(527)-N(7))-methyltransferase RsmG [Yoonia sp.]|nr:16S rRNA (guanine(527)-N(7))-methyltransferase RsmG [Yoonia sp.]
MKTLSGIDVSRETIDRLSAFEDIVLKWNPKINLIAKSTVDDVWIRHIKDSAQLFQYAPANVSRWLDIGSGGGFPGIVVAVMSVGLGHQTEFTFIESDQRKATFLRAAARELGLKITVLAERVEETDAQRAGVITARALKSVSELMPMLDRHLAADGIAILPKGRTFADEIPAARENWRFDMTAHASITDADARILILKDIASD